LSQAGRVGVPRHHAEDDLAHRSGHGGRIGGGGEIPAPGLVDESAISEHAQGRHQPGAQDGDRRRLVGNRTPSRAREDGSQARDRELPEDGAP
jgi:hypothetical protein